MKKPVVDYRRFRLSKLNEPEFSHLKLLFWWIPYFIMYFGIGRLFPPEKCTMIHSVIDDKIAFCEFFVIPYVLWYFLILVSLVYFALYNIDNFKKLQKYIIIIQYISMVIYFLYPTTQLRAEVIEGDNICTSLVGLIYTLDNNTNACPSLHVAVSIAIASIWLREKSANHWVKIFIVILAILICISTMYIKQHSIIDVFAAVPVCLVAEIFLFGRKHIKKIFRKK